MMNALLPLTTMIESGGKFAQSVKYAARAQGLRVGSVRPPLLDMTKEFELEFKEVLDATQTSLRAIINERNTAKNETDVETVN